MDLAKWFRGLNPGMGYAQVIPPMPELPPEWNGLSIPLDPLDMGQFLIEIDQAHIQAKVNLRSEYGA